MPIEYEKKGWGETACVVQHATFTLHHIKVVPGGFCSRHIHEHRANGFFVVSGTLKVRRWPGGVILVPEEVLLKAGDYLAVPPRIEHQFATDDGCEALEVYFPQLPDPDDIVRYSVGGIAATLTTFGEGN